MGERVEWVNGGPPASTRFEATLERRPVPRTKRVAALIADIATGLMESSASPDQPFNVSRYRYRIRVRDRLHGTVVHEQDWKGDDAGARESLKHIEQDLDKMNVAELCKEYNITLGS